MGDVFVGLAVREPQARASEAFRLFGEQHRNIEKIGHEMIKKVKPVSIFQYHLSLYLQKFYPIFMYML